MSNRVCFEQSRLLKNFLLRFGYVPVFFERPPINHDPLAIFNDIVKRQSAPGKKLVSFPPRRPVGFIAAPSVASQTLANASQSFIDNPRLSLQSI
jgi:hypothetical protein